MSSLSQKRGESLGPMQSISLGEFVPSYLFRATWMGVRLIALTMTAFGLTAQAVASSNCPAPPGAAQIDLPSGLPPALRDQMGDIALPGQPFNAIDVYVKGEPNRRYIFVWNIGVKWIVAVEQGGIALRSAVYVYNVGNDGKTATLIDRRIEIPTDACGAATELAGR